MEADEVQQFLRSGFIFGLKHDRLAIGWGEMKKSQKPQGPCSVFAPDFYFEDPNPWLNVPEFQIIDRELFARDVLPKLTTEVKDFHWIEPERSTFDRQLKSIRQAFETGVLKKAVPVIHAQALEPLTQSRLIGILRALSKAPPTLTAYGFWVSNADGTLREGILGASPEVLFSISGCSVKTMALAGTRSKAESADGVNALLNDPKERHEHQLVIDDIRTVLSTKGQVAVGETVVTELPTLFHLKTEISVTTDSAPDFGSLARDLHPTPALGLSPRSLGLDFLKSWDEVKDRGRFGAPFGLDLQLEDGSRVQDCLVAIRNIQWKNGPVGVRIQIGSGCGIVPESVADREWAELRLKRDSVKKVLGI